MKRIVLAAIVGMIGLVAGLTAQSAKLGSVQKVAEGIWVVPTDSTSNAAWFTVGDEVVAVDTGGDAATGKLLLEKIQETAGKPVRFAIITHAHRDHAGGMAPFLAAGAQVICHENAAPGLASLAGSSARNRPAFLVVSDRLLLFGGARRVAIYHLGPAHTSGDLVVLLPEDKVLFPGDIALGKRIPYMQGSDVDPKGWENVIGRLAQLDVNKVVPGHGTVESRQALADTFTYIKKVNELAQIVAREDVPEDLIEARLHQPDASVESAAITPELIANVRSAARVIKGKSERTPTPAAPATPARTPPKSKN